MNPFFAHTSLRESPKGEPSGRKQLHRWPSEAQKSDTKNIDDKNDSQNEMQSILGRNK